MHLFTCILCNLTEEGTNDSLCLFSYHLCFLTDDSIQYLYIGCLRSFLIQPNACTITLLTSVSTCTDNPNLA